MNRSPLYLAWRYLTYHWVKTLILVASLMLIVFLPVALRVLVKQSVEELTARAESTPLLVGTRGSPLELVLNSLYFESDTPELTSYGEAIHIAESELATPIPLYVRFQARDHPIVGTTLEYFDFRGLEIATGRSLALLGECVLGAKASRSLEISTGGTIVSSPESVFDLAGVYPLKMKVVGVLAPTNTPDDIAVFVDIKTTWVIEGLVHGHQDMAAPEATSGVLVRDSTNIVANASVIQYNEITAENVDSFHFHGDNAGYPISAVIAVPRDRKSEVILMGRYEGAEETTMIVPPVTVMDELLGTILTVQDFVVAAVIIVGLSTLATAVLVFLLSLRLRRREIETMVRIGGARASIISVVASEILVVLVVAVLLAGGLTLLTSAFGSEIIRRFILS